MPREDQRYVTELLAELLAELLGVPEIEKRYDWARGDPGTRAKGTMLPFDAVWERRRLIVEIDERQHGEAVAFFDKPDRMTVSGVDRGAQRRLYDERKVRLAREQGYAVVRIPTSTLGQRGRHLAYDRDSDKRVLRERLSAAGIKTG